VFPAGTIAQNNATIKKIERPISRD